MNGENLNFDKEQYEVGASWLASGKYSAYIRKKDSKESIYSEVFSTLEGALQAALTRWKQLTGE